jgi:urea-proton symporter
MVRCLAERDGKMTTDSPAIGQVTHCVYICFGLFTNILVTAMLLTGGSAVVTSLTGMPTAAACFLLPLGVVIYTMFGG